MDLTIFTESEFYVYTDKCTYMFVCVEIDRYVYLYIHKSINTWTRRCVCVCMYDLYLNSVLSVFPTLNCLIFSFMIMYELSYSVDYAMWWILHHKCLLLPLLYRHKNNYPSSHKMAMYAYFIYLAWKRVYQGIITIKKMYMHGYTSTHTYMYVYIYTPKQYYVILWCNLKLPFILP